MSHRELFFFITSHNPHDRPGAGITTTTNLQKLPHRPPVGKDSYTDRQAQSPVLVAFSTNDMQSNNHHRALLLHRLCLLCVWLKPVISAILLAMMIPPAPPMLFLLCFMLMSNDTWFIFYHFRYPHQKHRLDEDMDFCLFHLLLHSQCLQGDNFQK